jgi:formate hydrogenlyase subunit 3/multisubunit Na+/H+ antiporter MnhD subunit
MRTDPVVYTLLTGVGVLMVALGGLWCATERRAARIVAYLLMIDLGISLLALGQGELSGLHIALGMASLRPLGAAVWAAGIANGFGEPAGPAPAQRTIRPAAVAAALIGAFSLAGLPLLGGFSGRWLTLSTAHGDDALVVGVVLFGIATSWFAVGRWGWSLASRPAYSKTPLGRGRTLLLVAGCAAVVVLGLIPGWLYAWGLPGLAVPLGG